MVHAMQNAAQIADELLENVRIGPRTRVWQFASDTVTTSYGCYHLFIEKPKPVKQEAML
jgi:hypothetical protein